MLTDCEASDYKKAFHRISSLHYLKFQEAQLVCTKPASENQTLKPVKLLQIFFNVDMDYLIGRSDIPRKGDIIPPGFDPLPLMRKVPLIGQIACGEPITAEENIADYVDVPAQYHCDFCLKCVGDSMIEANINDGDIVYIRKQPTVENGDIAAVRIGEEATLKRVYLDGECVVLAPANSKYPPRSYRGQELENIHIEGKAVGFTHWF